MRSPRKDYLTRCVKFGTSAVDPRPTLSGVRIAGRGPEPPLKKLVMLFAPSPVAPSPPWRPYGRNGA